MSSVTLTSFESTSTNHFFSLVTTMRTQDQLRADILIYVLYCSLQFH